MIFSETLKQGHLINDQSFVSDPELDNLSHDDGSLWCRSPEEQNGLSDLNREGHKRRDQFHTVSFLYKADTCT